jgi:hypothetical protein
VRLLTKSIHLSLWSEVRIACCSEEQLQYFWWELVTRECLWAYPRSLEPEAATPPPPTPSPPQHPSTTRGVGLSAAVGVDEPRLTLSATWSEAWPALLGPKPKLPGSRRGVQRPCGRLARGRLPPVSWWEHRRGDRGTIWTEGEPARPTVQPLRLFAGDGGRSGRAQAVDVTVLAVFLDMLEVCDSGARASRGGDSDKFLNQMLEMCAGGDPYDGRGESCAAVPRWPTWRAGLQFGASVSASDRFGDWYEARVLAASACTTTGAATNSITEGGGVRLRSLSPRSRHFLGG